MDEIITIPNLILFCVALAIGMKLYGVLGDESGFKVDEDFHDGKKGQKSSLDGDNEQEDDDEANGSLRKEDLVKEKVREQNRVDDLSKKLKHSVYGSLVALDNSFDEKSFIDGAKKAYKMVMGCYTDGKLDKIKSFVSEDVVLSLQSAINDNKSKKLDMDVEIVGFDKAEILDINITDKQVIASVLFNIQIISFVKNSAGEIVEGYDKKIQEINETWRFKRDYSDSKSSWSLSNLT